MADGGGAGPRVWMETFGCQMNVLDSQVVAGRLARAGYRMADAAVGCDVLLINTCSVRELSEQKVWSMLGRLDARGGGARPTVGVLGCMAERQAQQIQARMPFVRVICGPSRLDQLPQMLAAAAGGAGCQVAVQGRRARVGADAEGLVALDRERPLQRDARRHQAFVRITRGCNKFCSFCVVPMVRGAEAHRAPCEVVGEVRRLVDDGVAEVTLIGQTVNHYLWQAGGKTTSFAELLVRVHDEVPSLARLRFLTSYPRDFGDDALAAMAACPRICRSLHVPAQSGSDPVLAAMNRGYTRGVYLDFLARARARMPDLSVSGDMIAGFPTETEADHQLSVSLLDEARYKSCFIFKYSPRSGTVAARRLLDDVGDATRRRRHAELLSRQTLISGVHHRRLIGRRVEVLVERVTSQPRAAAASASPPVVVGWRLRRPWTRLVGRTTGDEVVAFDGPEEAIGRQLPVMITDAENLRLVGELAP